MYLFILLSCATSDYYFIAINGKMSFWLDDRLVLIRIFIIFAAGIISLLEEPMPELKVFALKKLDMIVDEFWPEISEAIEKMYVIE